MAKSFKSVRFYFVLLLVSSSLVLVSEARPLNDVEGRPRNPIITKGIEIFFDGLYIEGIKTGGPSGGGAGHAFTNAQTLESKDTAGPSAGGKGHAFTDAPTLEAKNSGPSAGGNGHAFTSAQTLKAKDSGPSPGEGH
ncbi:hypothetical protein WN944_008520 [Citrus x changshan-huyou]|uniref:Uncharacterized protein n=3 Tax=Citrus TaxID=2706 RepID=A0ACB8KUM6_CITSI|nr:hypothetical protein KPL71_016594 [Citrus sinensis]KDO84033.1 hypothetical protein CISIN_1g032680mg [Citrus sinensis]GAY39588.1 hypothetical protein CUMW_045490 [Citrus unshiu]